MIEVTPVSGELREALQAKIDGKTKPRGALGRLEALALQLGLIQHSLTPNLRAPTIVVFAGDHGITAEGVSAYPAEVTAQMVANFMAGGAGINVFARQHGIEVRVVDAGVNGDLTAMPGLLQRKVAPGTRNARRMAAMEPGQANTALAAGAGVVDEVHAGGSNVIGFGEMGIGNTSSAAMLMALLLELPVSRCVGAGAGLDAAGLAHKQSVLEAAVERARGTLDGPAGAAPLAVLAQCGGFETAMIAGAMLRAAALRMVILVDGFITTSALLVARALQPAVLDYCVFCHRSDERGHGLMLEALGADPLLDLGLRLGEGTGAALAYPLLQAAVGFLDEMASFESAAVSGKR